MLAQKIGIVFNPLIQNANNSYQMLTTQMGRIVDFFGAPPVLAQQIPLVQIVKAGEILVERPKNLVHVVEQQPVTVGVVQQ